MTLPGTGSAGTNLFFSQSNREDGPCRLSRRSTWWISRRSNLHGRTLPGRAFLRWQPVFALPEEMSKRFRRGEEGRKYSFPRTGKEGEPLLFARFGPALSLEGRGGGAHSASRKEEGWRPGSMRLHDLAAQAPVSRLNVGSTSGKRRSVHA